MGDITITVRPVRGTSPQRSGVWRGQRRALRKLTLARSLGWDEFAAGNWWLTWVGING